LPKLLRFKVKQSADFYWKSLQLRSHEIQK
jgi:hypothetical protein